MIPENLDFLLAHDLRRQSAFFHAGGASLQCYVETLGVVFDDKLNKDEAVLLITGSGETRWYTPLSNINSITPVRNDSVTIETAGEEPNVKIQL